MVGISGKEMMAHERQQPQSFAFSQGHMTDPGQQGGTGSDLYPAWGEAI